MDKIDRDQKRLAKLSIILIIFGIVMIGLSIGLIIWGVNVLKTSLVWGIIMIVVGALLILMFLRSTIYAIFWYITAKAAVTTDSGSVKDDIAGKGTVNMVKCANCGNEVGGKDKVCGNCGKSLASTKNCPKCGTENNIDNKNCTECGESF